MKNKILLGALALAGMTSAHAVDIQAGEWTVSVGGNVNAYVTSVKSSGDNIGLAGEGTGGAGQDRRTSVGNGLLPNGLVVGAKSKQGEFDVGGTIGIYVHTATNDALTANSGVDVRQAFMTIGNASMGTVKLGRDYGLFGFNAIVSDMTLLGVGAPVQGTQRGRVSLGHIGAGYSYTGAYGQVRYTAPTTGGITFDAALMSPVDVGADAASVYDSRSAPQLQFQVGFGADQFKGWVGAKTQKFYAIDQTADDDFTMSAFEIGGSYNVGPFGLLVNVQSGKGIGILTDGDQGDVRGMNYLTQVTYKTSAKNKIGLGYGKSRNKGDEADFKSNENLTLGNYYSLNKNVTIATEIGQTKSKGAGATAGQEAKLKGVSVGAIFFF